MTFLINGTLSGAQNAAQIDASSQDDALSECETMLSCASPTRCLSSRSCSPERQPVMTPLRHGSVKLSSAVLSRKEINYNTIVGASRNRNADPSHSLSPECAPVMTMSRCGPSKLSSAVLSPSEMKHNHNMKQLLDTKSSDPPFGIFSHRAASSIQESCQPSTDRLMLQGVGATTTTFSSSGS